MKIIKDNRQIREVLDEGMVVVTRTDEVFLIVKVDSYRGQLTVYDMKADELVNYDDEEYFRDNHTIVETYERDEIEIHLNKR